MLTKFRHILAAVMKPYVCRAVIPFILYGLISSACAASSITLEVGAGKLIELKSNVATAFAADPKVAEVRPANSTTLFVFGTGPGQTTISAADAAGHPVGQYFVTVNPAQYPAVHAHDLTRQENTARIQPRMGPGGITLNGSAPDAESAERAVASAQDEVGKDTVYNRMRMSDPIQVNLQVQVVEMSRQMVRELGVQWENVNALGTSAAIGLATMNPLAAMAASQSSFSFLSRFRIAGRPTTLQTVIDVLAQDELVHMLAEPNLTTMSGEAASFLVGGEYPIPIASYNNTVSVQYKQYGVSLSFVPTVLTGGRINLHVRPEVSQLSATGAVSFGEGNNSVSIPALTVSRVDTTVELGSGQSFAIAGLFQDSTTTTSLGLPGLSEIPILGALFRSNSFQHNQSELVIIVTPYIVRPVANPGLLARPDANWTPPNDSERALLGYQSGKRTSLDVKKTQGTAVSKPAEPLDIGFVVD
ncbi:pilus assembly protein N-terminal domain-containing protein [Acetobacter fallax]|uniref:pilus assembly protein N-terminal domain-containing protein n=1 Tax=Acetobacter fallax TaxID=1737473 RepID=UPI00156B8214